MREIADALGANVSRETSEKMDHYLSMLQKWNKAINLVSPGTLEDARNRHFVDSAQLFSLIPKESRSLADLGSGGGFPGLVLAILAGQFLPDLRVTLVESDQRKASFLRSVLRETETEGMVLADRIDQIPSLAVDVLTARALAALPILCGFTARHLKPDGVALFPKGKSWGKEVEDSRSQWKFSLVSHKSMTDPDAVVLELRELAHD